MTSGQPSGQRESLLLIKSSNAIYFLQLQITRDFLRNFICLLIGAGLNFPQPTPSHSS